MSGLLDEPGGTLPAIVAADGEVRVSGILASVVLGGTGTTVGVGEMNAALGDRAFGIVILALALPNCVLAPPGFGGVTGILMAVFAVQLLLGYRRPRLPAWFERRRFDRAGFARILGAVTPHLRRLERIARPRFGVLVNGAAERWIGGAMLVLAIVVALPIPFANWLPGVALLLLAVGLIERDGAAVLLGGLFGLAGLAAAVAVTGGFVVGAAALAGWAMG